MISVWVQQGTEQEDAAIRDIAASFDVAHAARGVRVALQFLPAEAIFDALTTGNAESHPDALTVSGTQLSRYVEAGFVTSIDAWFDRNELEDFLPVARQQGTIGGRLYALPAIETGAALFYDRAAFAKAEVIPPAEGRAWTWEQFLSVCERLERAGLAPVVIDLNQPDAQMTALFAPLVWSGGGDLVAETGDHVAGVFAARENVTALRAWQQLFTKNYVVAPAEDGSPFARGKAAMEWTDHRRLRDWVTLHGENLGAMLPPRLGARPITASGSWAWAISAKARDRERAALWLKWATDLRHGIEPLVRATGGLPARRSGFTLFPEYSRLPYRMFRDQLELTARPFPSTPHFDVISKRFAAALRDVARGSRVEPELRRAEREIQAAIERKNSGASLAE